MNFEELKNNVESWAEAGELADAKIKGDTAGMMDANGLDTPTLGRCFQQD